MSQINNQVSWRRPLALACTLVVLGTLTYWHEFSHKPKKEEAEERTKKIFDLKDHPVSAMKIVNGSKTFGFKCLDVQKKLCKPGDNSKWEVTEPTQFKADDSNVNALISALNNLIAADVIDLSDETADKRAHLMKEYKLDSESRGKSDSVRITMTPVTGETESLFLGDIHPISGARFSAVAFADKVNDSRVILIPAAFNANLDHDMTYWRDKKLLTIDAYDVMGFTLNGSKGAINGERKNGQWIISSPKSTASMPGDIENIDNLITAATYLSAKSFAAENRTAAQAILKGTKKVLSLSLATKTTKSDQRGETTLTFFEKKAADAKSIKLYATVSNLDPLYEIEAVSKERMDKSIKDFRLSKLITSMDRFSVKRMEFEGTPIGTPITLIQKGTKWMNGESEVDNAQVQEILDKISGNRIKDFMSGAKIPEGEQNGLKITLKDDAGATKQQFAFWQNGDRFYARDLKLATGAVKEALLVDTAIRDALPWGKDFFKKPGTVPPAKH